VTEQAPEERIQKIVADEVRERAGLAHVNSQGEEMFTQKGYATGAQNDTDEETIDKQLSPDQFGKDEGQ
jgi:hypothetical protein